MPRWTLRRPGIHAVSVTTDTTETVLGVGEPDPAPAPSMRQALRGGGRAGVAAAAVEQTLSAVTTVVLARLLTPGDFGVVAAANVVVGLVALVSQVGIGPAIVKRREVDDRVLSTLFWTGGLAAGAGSLAVVVLAPLLARALAIGDAAPYVVVLAPTLLIRAWAAVPRAILQRRLAFGQVFLIEIVVAVAYTSVQIGLAAAGAGAWSVVVGQLTAAVLLLALLLARAGWLPRRHFDRSVVRQEARFGVGYLSTMVLTWLTKNLDYWVVARIGGSRVLGIYYVAYVLPTIVRQRLTVVATDVLLPAFSRMQDDAERLVESYLLSLRLHAFVGFPSMAGLAVVAGPIVEVFFGDQWRDAVAPMRLLAVAAAVEFATQAVTTVFLAVSRPQLTARVQLVRLVTLVLGLVPAALADSVVAVAVAVLVATGAGAVAAQVLLTRAVGGSVARAVRALLPVLVPTLLMTAAAAATLKALSGPVPDLLLASVVGATVYVGSGLVLFPRATRTLLGEAMAFVRPGAGLPR